jgi:hypothetical protein
VDNYCTCAPPSTADFECPVHDPFEFRRRVLAFIDRVHPVPSKKEQLAREAQSGGLLPGV